jgi:hypothetical protein
MPAAFALAAIRQVRNLARRWCLGGDEYGYDIQIHSYNATILKQYSYVTFLHFTLLTRIKIKLNIVPDRFWSIAKGM